MAEKFVKSVRYSPALDSRGCIHDHIYRQTKEYKTQDPSTNREKFLPPIVFKHRLGIATLPHEQARVWLVCIALCFPMRSCEYAYMGKNEKKTRVVRACNISFLVGARVIQHSHPLLY